MSKVMMREEGKVNPSADQGGIHSPCISFSKLHMCPVS